MNKHVGLRIYFLILCWFETYFRIYFLSNQFHIDIHGRPNVRVHCSELYMCEMKTLP